MGMDIAGLSSAVSQAQLQQQVSTAVLKKGLSIAKEQGQAAVQLIENAAQISSSSAGGCQGCGGKLDVTG
jgi:Fe-S cluster biogenesis protein NfuA